MPCCDLGRSRSTLTPSTGMGPWQCIWLPTSMADVKPRTFVDGDRPPHTAVINDLMLTQGSLFDPPAGVLQEVQTRWPRIWGETMAIDIVGWGPRAEMCGSVDDRR
jgi:hypothetical protein